MIPVLRPLEELQRNAAIGVRFWDAATASAVIDGLVVDVFPRSAPRARKRAQPNRSGIYVAHEVSGLKDFEFDATEPAEAPWDRAAASPMRSYRIEVRDPFGRFHPMAFDADLPVRGLLGRLAPLVSPPLISPPLVPPADAGSPPQWLSTHIPLFSTASRPVPHPLAAVYAQLKEQAGSRVPAWSLLGVSIGGEPCGLGLADQRGRVAVMFPYPEPPRMPLASPPQARNDFSWTVALQAYSDPALARRSPDIPDLGEVLAQLALPRAVLASVLSPAGSWRLEYRVPLTVRTEGLAAAEASYLMLSPP